jgi:hypothetical protein
MTTELARDGDSVEQYAWSRFVQAEFPAYERFWLSYVVPLTNRPRNIHFLKDADLSKMGKGPEDVATAQLHYTLLWHLVSAWDVRQGQTIGPTSAAFGLTSLVSAHDVAFEVLERMRMPGHYDPWQEGSRGATAPSGQDAQSEWKKRNKYPLQDIRDYRNKLAHGRVASMIVENGMAKWPDQTKLNAYVDWRNVTDASNSTRVSADFVPAVAILDWAWNGTLAYLRDMWRTNLGV